MKEIGGLHFISPRSILPPATSKLAFTAYAFFECINNDKLRLQHRHDDELRQSVERLQCEYRIAAIPATHHQRPLIIGVDQADQIAEHDAVFVPQPRARQNHRRVTGVADVQRKSGWDQVRRTQRPQTGSYQGSDQAQDRE